VIVAKFFEGDNDEELAWKQHDVYHQGLRTIFETCNRLTRFARNLLGDSSTSLWGTIERFDHRTLQDAHDLLAAAWRYRVDSRQGKFPFDPKFLSTDQSVEEHWLNWLRTEVQSWWENYFLVQQVQIILSNQNTEEGYVAEARLALELLRRFSDLPWDPKLQKAHENDLEGDPDEPPDIEEELEDESLLCECSKVGRRPCRMIPCMTLAARAQREGWGPLE
jgi:hypothetical protein